jgi:cytoskeletal protein RodZ
MLTNNYIFIQKLTKNYKKLRLAFMVIIACLFRLILLLILKIWNLNIFSKSFFENPFLDIFQKNKNVQISKSKKSFEKNGKKNEL